MQYETLIEDYHGHCFHNRFEASSDEEAKEKAIADGYGYFSSNDALWRVPNGYVNNHHFDAEQQRKMREEYIEIKI